MPTYGEPVYDFRSKYVRNNFLTRRLLDGFFDSARALLRGLPVRSAVELGCGEGFSTQRLAGFLPPEARFEASDVEERLVRAAGQRNPQVPFRQESIYRLSRPDNSVDLAFVLEVIEHLEDPDAAMREICRVVRRWALLSVPREPLWRALNLARAKYVRQWGNTPGHCQHWTTGGFRRFASRYGRVRGCRTPLPWTMLLLELPEPPAAERTP